MTPEERAERLRRSGETDRLLQDQIAFYRRRSAERWRRQRDWERRLVGRISRRHGLVD
jgi:hypothetical protein